MSPFILTAVLLAALLHAIWNALIKVSGDRLVVMAVTAFSTSLLALPFVFLLPAPERASWPFLFLSMCIHTTYMTMLVRAYGHGDFVQIYPLARGSAPLLTALLGFLLLQESLSSNEMAGMALIVASILGFAGERIGGIRQLTGAALGYSLLTGLCITGYSLVDGQGARLAANSHSYTAWMFLLHGMLFPLVAWLRRRGQLFSSARRVWKPGLAVAIISALAYWIVIWAFSQERIAPVAVLRETSVAFAAVISAFIIKEKLTRMRVLLILLIIAGIVLLAG
ncbi:MAG: EamA family transporter [Gammaproteobacteria bacterium]|nr:EamA family transporter [Pseudomonadales bacterium]MCP5348084.1 EamA family transporter [Pseudomonadales bacterium]